MSWVAWRGWRFVILAQESGSPWQSPGRSAAGRPQTLGRILGALWWKKRCNQHGLHARGDHINLY